ncbi:MAG: STAS domain-containing protein [Gammaproteobacteria bacterium]|nr:STAS domain-containing protein [Gammaproteobacteria bacterium]
MLTGMHLTAIGDNNMLLEPTDALDPSSPDDYVAELMEVLQKEEAQTLMYDLNQVPLIDQVYYNWLIRLNNLCRLANVELVIVNIRTTAAFSLAMSLKTAPPFKCSLDVDSARHGITASLQD